MIGTKGRGRIICLMLAIMLSVWSFAGCGGEDGERPPAIKSEYTISFDVGAEARAAGVKTPPAQVVKRNDSVTMPVIEYEAGSTWYVDHELVYWHKGDNKRYSFSAMVGADFTLKAYWRKVQGGDVAAEYERNLDWGEEGHLYIHYLRGAHDAGENGKTNPAEKPTYSEQIDSVCYGDWGLWVWEKLPHSGEGRAFYPCKIDESGAVYDIDLTANYSDAGWDSVGRTDKGLKINYRSTVQIGIQVFSQDSRIHGGGFWVNDGGDVYITLADAERDGGDYHWFVVQSSVSNGTPTYKETEVDDPYAGLEPGEAVSTFDVVSNKGNNDVYTQQPVATGWEDNSVGYQIFVASFADSDGDGIGDLRGITEKLDYLDGLGVDTLWLTPFQQSNTYHGYEIMDYFTVDPRFGTLDDYRELVYSAHKRGMKVLMDFVLNHTSVSNPWFRKSSRLVKELVKQSDGSYRLIDYRNFYNWTNEDNVPKTGAAANQWFKDSNGYYYYSSFNSSMPELNFDYQATRDAILDVALYWMSFGLDGFRLDAVKHIYMENENPYHSDNIIKDIGATGDYSYDVDKNVHFFMEFNAKLKASYPNAILVGENFNGDPIKIASLYGGMDSQFNFNWYYDTTGCLGTIAQNSSVTTQYQYAAKAMNQYAATQFDFSLYRNDYIDGVFTSNHDVQRARDRVLNAWSNENNDWIGTGATTAEDVALSEELAKLWAGMCMTVPGMTWIYCGDELGMFGSKTDNADGVIGHEDRWLRQPMKWSKLKADSEYNCEYSIGFSNYVMTWDKNNLELDGAAEQAQDEQSIYSVYKALIALRKSNKAFSRGTVTNKTQAFQNGMGTSLISYSVASSDSEYMVYVNATGRSIGTTNSISGTFVYSTTGVQPANNQIPALTLAVYKIN